MGERVIKHPKKGSKIKVEPIRNIDDIRLIKRILRDKPLDLALFVVGINTGLMPSRLLGLKVVQVKGLKPGDQLYLIDNKFIRREPSGPRQQLLFDEQPGRYQIISLNKACIEAIGNLLKSSPERHYLFEGQRQPKTDKSKPINISTLNRKVKSWCSDIKLSGNYGGHTLRKTWGYHQIETYKVPIEEIMRYLNHPTRQQTIDYLCLPEYEEKNIFKNII